MVHNIGIGVKGREQWKKPSSNFASAKKVPEKPHIHSLLEVNMLPKCHDIQGDAKNNLFKMFGLDQLVADTVEQKTCKNYDLSLLVSWLLNGYQKCSPCRSWTCDFRWVEIISILKVATLYHWANGHVLNNKLHCFK